MTYNDPDGVNGPNPQIVTFNFATTAGTVAASIPATGSIAISMPYTYDSNNNNTYSVEYGDYDADSWTTWVDGTSVNNNTASPYTDTITGLDSAQIYDVRMTYHDPDGAIGDNPQYVFNIVPLKTATWAGTATAEIASGASIAISMPWTYDTNNNNTYTIEYSNDGGSTWQTWVDGSNHQNISPYNTTITGLTMGETYDVRVTYNDPDGVGGEAVQIFSSIFLPSENATFAGTATVVTTSSSSIAVSMPYTYDNNGDNSYTVQYRITGTGTWVSWGTFLHTASPFEDTITGLSEGRTYDVRLIYNDPDGVNEITDPAVQEFLAITLPLDKTRTETAMAFAAGEDSIYVSMPYLGDDNNNNSFTIAYKLSSSETWIDGGTAGDPDDSPYTGTIDSLTPGATYDVRMTYNDPDGVLGINPQYKYGITLAALPVTNVVRVCSSGGNFTEIQSAIDDPGVTDGYTVLVCPDTYSENISFGTKNITVRSEGGPGVTLIQGKDPDTDAPVVSLNSDGILDGFTINNQRDYSGGAGFYGSCRGFLVSSGVSPTIRNSIIQGNHITQSGSALYTCLLYTSPSPRDRTRSRMPSSA